MENDSLSFCSIEEKSNAEVECREYKLLMKNNEAHKSPFCLKPVWNPTFFWFKEGVIYKI